MKEDLKKEVGALTKKDSIKDALLNLASLYAQEE